MAAWAAARVSGRGGHCVRRRTAIGVARFLQDVAQLAPLLPPAIKFQSGTDVSVHGRFGAALCGGRSTSQPNQQGSIGRRHCGIRHSCLNDVADAMGRSRRAVSGVTGTARPAAVPAIRRRRPRLSCLLGLTGEPVRRKTWGSAGAGAAANRCIGR